MRRGNGGLLLALLAAMTLISLLLDVPDAVWGNAARRHAEQPASATPEVRQEILRGLVDFIY